MGISDNRWSDNRGCTVLSFFLLSSVLNFQKTACCFDVYSYYKVISDCCKVTYLEMK